MSGEILKTEKKLVVRGQSEKVKLEELRKKNNEE